MATSINPAWTATATKLKAIRTGPEADHQFQTTVDTDFPIASKATERHAFLTWYVAQSLADFNAAKSKLSPKPMNPTTYLSTLQAVDWTSIDSIAHYYAAVHGGGSIRFGAEPLPLGKDGDIIYYLQPEMAPLGASSDLRDNAQQHLYVMNMRPAAGTAAAPFKYGYRLGTLGYIYAVQSGQMAQTIGKLHRTPFYVYLDVQSPTKDLYIVFQTAFDDANGDEVPLDGQTNVWEYLPSPQGLRPICRVYKIGTLQDIARNGATRQFFNPSIGGTGFPTLLVPWLADKETVTNALRGTGRKDSGIGPVGG